MILDMRKFILLLLCIVVTVTTAFLLKKEDTLYISAPMFPPLGEYNNTPGAPLFGYHLPTELKKYGLRVKCAKNIKKLKNCKKIVLFELYPDNILKYLPSYPKEKLILFLWEPPSTIPHNYDANLHQYFSKIYTWDDALVDNQKYFKLFYPALSPMCSNPTPFSEKKLCILMSKNGTSSHPNELYSARKDIIAFFEKRAPQDLDFYGKDWDKDKYHTYKGIASSKECFKNYRFNICYENISNIKGYVSEKIFDSFAWGCVPVYLGASNITDYIPKGCFIDRRDFASNEELYEFLKNMSEERYAQYIEEIQKFLKSEKASLFSGDHFFETFKEALDL